MLLKAHIFKKRSRGEREEVEIKLFNMDDTDVELGGGGSGGASLAFHGAANMDPVPNDGNEHDVALGSSDAPLVEGFELTDGELHGAPAGLYSVQLRGEWTNFGSADTGYINARLLFYYGEDDWVDTAIALDQMGPDLETPFIRNQMFVAPEEGYFKLTVAQALSPSHSATFDSFVSIAKL
jgi:hypothetical protein